MTFALQVADHDPDALDQARHGIACVWGCSGHVNGGGGPWGDRLGAVRPVGASVAAWATRRASGHACAPSGWAEGRRGIPLKRDAVCRWSGANDQVA